MKKGVLAVLAFGVVAGSYWLSRQYFEEEEAGAEFDQGLRSIAVEIAAVTRQDLRETITYPGSILADETVSISPRVSGKIRAIHVDTGDRVDEGDPLVIIDDAEFVERLKQAKANLRHAQAQLKKSRTQVELTKRAYERVQQLTRNGVSMLQELDNAQAAYESAQADLDVSEAEVERVEAAIEEAELNLADTRIESPLTGWVQARHADPGTLANPSSPILTIVDMDPAEVVVYVPERELGVADVGRGAVVQASRNDDRTYEGTISRVAPSLSMSTRTTEVIIDVPNPHRELRPGMSAEATLVFREVDNALVIPTKALIFQDGESSVYRIENGKAYRARVETGIEQDDLIQVTSGLEQGDRIVSKGQYLLKDGQPVIEGSEGEMPSSNTKYDT